MARVMRLRRRRHTLRYDQRPRSPRADRVLAYTVATLFACVIAWVIFTGVAKHAAGEDAAMAAHSVPYAPPWFWGR